QERKATVDGSRPAEQGRPPLANQFAQRAAARRTARDDGLTIVEIGAFPGLADRDAVGERLVQQRREAAPAPDLGTEDRLEGQWTDFHRAYSTGARPLRQSEARLRGEARSSGASNSAASVPARISSGADQTRKNIASRTRRWASRWRTKPLPLASVSTPAAMR